MNRTPVILAVDDDAAFLEIMCTLLREDGAYEVISAPSAERGLELAQMRRPDLILSDQNMGGMNGIEFCREIRKDPLIDGTVFILVTAMGGSGSLVTGLDAGADDYITKPFDSEVLLSKVRAFLRIKRLQDELREDRAELQRLTEALSMSIDGITTLLVNIISLRVPNAAPRAAKAARLAEWMARRLDFPQEDLELIGIAARIHEIGKINMPDEILSKPPESLTREDRETLAHSPMFGQMLVGNVHQIRGLGKVIRNQLENYDGTGHPDHLLREEIPLPSRVLRLVSFLEDLPTSVAGETDEIVARLRHARGTLLDPRIALLAEEYVVTEENPAWLEGKGEVALSELQEGMVIAADLMTASGLKLLAKDSRLSHGQIERIHSHHRSDPIINKIYVYLR